MTDFPVYETTGICRSCSREYPTKCFSQRAADNPVRGFCPDCQGADDEKMRQLTQPPKPHGKPKPEPESTEPGRSRPRWEPE